MWKREASSTNLGLAGFEDRSSGLTSTWGEIGGHISNLARMVTGQVERGFSYTRTEKQLVILRLFCVLFTTPILFLFGLEQWQLLAAGALMVGILVYDAAVYYLLDHYVHLLNEGRVTAVADGAIAVSITLLGGGFATPWYYCLYGYLVSIAARFGLRAAFTGSFAIVAIDGAGIVLAGPDAVTSVGAFLFRSSFLIVTILISAFLFAQAKSAESALERQLDQERSLNQATEVLDATLDPKVVLQAAVDGARRIGKARRGILRMKEAQATIFQSSDEMTAVPASKEDLEVIDQVLRTGQSVMAYENDGARAEIQPDNPRSLYLGFPLRRRGNCIGGIALCWPEDTDTSQYEGVLSAFAERVTVALENSTLYERAQELAVIDPLTGLSNHRYIKERLDIEIERAKRYGHELSVAMFDLDRFKEYNDTYGHGAGDEVLRQMADVLRASVRRTDLVGRYGGEEFLLIMPETDLETALSAAERVRAAVSEIKEPVTVSAGVAAFPMHSTDRDPLLNTVDLATLLAKHLGRNQVRSATEVGSNEGVRAVFSELAAHLSLPSSTWGPGLATDLERRLRQVGELEFVTPGKDDVEGELTDATVETIMALAQTIDAKDPWTEGHSRNVSNYAVALARELNLETAYLEEIRMAGLLHDIGKIGITDNVLKKPGPLTEEEWSLMRQHPVIGSRILMPVRALRSMVRVVRHHHEWYNGSGYPDGIRGEDIPLGARILAVCDAYDAMVTKRTYRNSLGREEAIRRLEAGKGTQFDPQLVDTFLIALQSQFPVDQDGVGDAVPEKTGA